MADITNSSRNSTSVTEFSFVSHNSNQEHPGSIKTNTENAEHPNRGRQKSRKPKEKNKESLATFSSMKMKKKSNTTCLYLRIDLSIGENFNLYDFLLERMEKPTNVKFKILKRTKTRNGTLVTLEFGSKRLAGTVHENLKLSNRKSQIQIDSSLDQNKVDSSVTAEKDQQVFQKHLQAIGTRAQMSLKNHDLKIIETQDDIENLQKKQISVSGEHRKSISSQIHALQDKLQELKDQRKEYQNFLKSLTEKLMQCWEDNTFNKKVKDIGKLFGVECCKLESALPMYAKRSDIVEVVMNNKACVILGETGSGKSTQMAQYLHQVGFAENGMIVCTQPRKVAAISLARRVATEMATNVGQLVGYRVGMKTKVSAVTKILYTTDHAFLNECLTDRLLSKYSCVIIDEAHERSIYTDLLLGMIKRCLHVRNDLKVIITSATIDPDIFVRFFNGCPVLKVSGRMFPVEVIWQPVSDDEDIFEKYQQAAVEKAVEIHRRKPEGDILVFMTSPLETEKCCEEFKERMKDSTSFQCHVLHGQVQVEEQQLIFEPTPPNKRKIVFATNSAETSITIPGIKYVVDTGLAKEKKYDPKRNMSSLNVVMISRSSAEQRKGRAGRTGPGTCYRLYSKQQFDKMDASFLPEILKLHLGQAMLKLYELGINPQEYDFVESPGKAAIEGAVKTLEDIGAIKNDQITDTGQWLAKLPIEPRTASIIARGKEKDVLYESVVLAAVTSIGSYIFFRGSSEEDKKKSDSQKMKFCHYGGDSLSLLNVFREWNDQPEKMKNQWCFENAINAKAMRNARDVVNEICTVLKKELDIVVKRSFADSSVTDKILQHILFECFSSNICLFLGREKAGYYAARLDQQVHIHPSSVLNSLGIVPQWMVFEQMLKTSRDFVIGLTPLEDAAVDEAARNGILHYDIDTMKTRRVYLVHTESVGSTAFWRIIGRKFCNLKVLQENICKMMTPSFALLEEDIEKGEFRFYAERTNTKQLAEVLKQEISVVQDELKKEDLEYSLSEHNLSVKIIIGQGGEVKEVLMPNDYRKIFIEKPDIFTNEDTVMKKFGTYGEIKECKMYDNRRNLRWGWLKFQKTEYARRAVDATQNDDHEVAIAETSGQGSHNSSFKVKITWCRRKSKEHAFVSVAAEELPRILSQHHLFINGRAVTINVDKKTGLSLYLNKLSPETTENDINGAILHAIGEETNENIIEKTTVVRERVETTPDMLNEFRRQIEAALRQYAPSGQFKVKVIEPRPQTVTYLAFADFHDPDEGQRACTMLSGNFSLCSTSVLMEPDISMRIFVPADVMKVLEEDLKASFDYINKIENKTKLYIRQLSKDNFATDIKSSDAVQMARVCRVIQDILKGDVLECAISPDLKYVFTKTGKEFLASLQNKMPCVIVADNRTMTISIKGKTKVRTEVFIAINNFLDTIAAEGFKEFFLRGPERPGGVMKKLTDRYGTDLEMLKKEVGLSFVHLDHRRHRVEVSGSAEAVKKVQTIVDSVVTELTKVKTVKPETEDKRPDCVVCFTSIDKGELYRLEVCGHPYCTDCILQQIHSALDHKEFPLQCAEERCQMYFMLKDLQHFIKKGSLSLNRLVESSVSDFVAKHQTEYRYCLSPDCPVVYRVTCEGSVFRCCRCQMRICTSCHIQYHEGLTCAMYRSEKDGGTALFEKWMKNNKNTKLCPNCQTPIEKTEGCNRMQCSACKKFFCWLCGEQFDSSADCYTHLNSKHGGCFDVPD